METVSIEWRRPVPQTGEKPVDPRVAGAFAAINRALGTGPMAASMQVHVKTPEEASKVFNALAGILRALTADQPRPQVDQGPAFRP